MKIDKIVQQMIGKYRTRDPFAIAREMDVMVKRVPLLGARGFYHYYKRNRIIYINEGLSQYEQTMICAHELGHAVLHGKMNRVFLENSTYMVANRFENEANLFAVHLLISEEEMEEYLLSGCTIDQIAEITGFNPVFVRSRADEYLSKR